MSSTPLIEMRDISIAFGGINGIMVDIIGDSGVITADDFEFRVGNTASWPAPEGRRSTRYPAPATAFASRDASDASQGTAG